jgi:hypothetical protein
MIYVALGDATVDERGFAVLRQIRAEHGDRMSLAEFKATVREQFFMLLIDEERALGGIAEIARREPAGVGDLLAALRRVAAAKGAIEGERARRLARVETLFRDAATARFAEPAVTVVRADRPAAKPAGGPAAKSTTVKAG